MRRANGGGPSASPQNKRTSSTNASASFAEGRTNSDGRGCCDRKVHTKKARAPPLSPCTRHKGFPAGAPVRSTPTPWCRCCTARSQSALVVVIGEHEKGKSNAGPPLAFTSARIVAGGV